MATDLSEPFEHDENMQPFEQDGMILIAIVDQTYGISDDDNWERDREKFRLSLEHEFGLRFEDGNVGPSADLPAFITLLQAKKRVPVWVLLCGLFFMGKPLVENFQAWREIGEQLHPLLKRPAYLNRQGAAVIAVEAVVGELGHDPERLQLRGYRFFHVPELGDLGELRCDSQIADAPPTLFLGFIVHVFEIEADGIAFRVTVEGPRATILRLR